MKCANVAFSVVPGTQGGGGVGRGTLTFAYYRGSDYFFGFKILNFAFFRGGGCRGFVNCFYGYANLSRYFWGMPFSTGILFGCKFKNVYFVVFLIYKVH